MYSDVGAEVTGSGAVPGNYHYQRGTLPEAIKLETHTKAEISSKCEDLQSSSKLFARFAK